MSIQGTGRGYQPRGNPFERFDADRDGKLNKKEMTAFAESMSARRSGQNGRTMSAADLAKFDQDGDGMLSQSEMPRPPGPPPGMGDGFSRGGGRGPNPFASFDSNGDSVLSGDELTQMAQDISEHTGQTVTADQLLAMADADGDGALSASELPPPPPPPGPPPSEGFSFSGRDGETMAMSGEVTSQLRAAHFRRR
ncbi:MAG: hypothetical protein H6729_05755 [Deltaproteobacteria bacterium]|nr:hypothetical protein [Deltaproteobacteria bacterium]